jgi:hypothetical protein
MTGSRLKGSWRASYHPWLETDLKRFWSSVEAPKQINVVWWWAPEDKK